MKELKERFDIPGLVRIEPGHGGLARIVVSTPQAAAEIYLHGAQVTHFHLSDQLPVIWMSQKSLYQPGKAIRGGVPICFPWFGPRQDDAKAPVHGFARVRDWNLDSISKSGDDAIVVTLSLKSDEATRAIWPADFVARHTITISSTLQMQLDVQNASAQPIRFEEALHTYFTIGDIRQTTVEGLAGTTYIDKVGTIQMRQQSDPLIRFDGETDRVYLDTTATCVIHDPVMNRRIEVSKSGSNATVAWNPWIAKAKAMSDFGDEEWPGMLCVETVNAAKHAVELAPGAIHSMTQRVRVL